MQALGGLGLQASNETEFVSALESALDAQLPCLIDVLVDPSGYPQQLKAMRG